MIDKLDEKFLPFLSKELKEKIIAESKIVEFEEGTEILRQHQYIKVLPIVLSGLIKVYSRFKDKELLLYYIEPSQSCVMTFNAGLKNTPSKVYAVTEEYSKVLLIPIEILPNWLKKFPEFSELFYDQFNLRYNELLETISQLLVNNLDERLYEYLKRKSELNQHNPIQMSHKMIANELGTSREVISRIIKKLETKGKLTQISGKIKLISMQ